MITQKIILMCTLYDLRVHVFNQIESMIKFFELYTILDFFEKHIYRR